jgi:hypothetical protein
VAGGGYANGKVVYTGGYMRELEPTDDRLVIVAELVCAKVNRTKPDCCFLGFETGLQFRSSGLNLGNLVGTEFTLAVLKTEVKEKPTKRRRVEEGEPTP